jgi:hypothetical protein
MRIFLAWAAMGVAAHGQTKVDLRTQGKSVDFSAASTTRPSKAGTVLPSTCTVGETFLKTDAAAGKNLYVCTATNVWTVQGVEMPDPTGKANQLLTNDGTAFSWTGLGGDVSGSPGTVTVTGLSGRHISSLTPGDGQYLKWNGTSNQWEPTTMSALSQLPAAGGDLSGTLSSATVVKLQNRAVSLAAPATGQVLGWDGNQWTPQTVTGGNAGSPVDRTIANTYATGAKQTFVPSVSTSGINVAPNTLPLVPAAGDLAVDSLDSNKLKVYDGSQWNTLATATNYVATFTGQTSVLVLGTSHRLGTANLVVDCYDSSSPAQRVEPDKVTIDPTTFNVTVTFTSAQTGRCVISGQTATGGSGSGASMSSQLGDLSLVMTTSTVLTAGLNCSPSTPCNVRLGSTVFSVVTSSTVTLTAGTGTAYLYLDPSGVLTVGHNLTLTCSTGCTAASGVTGFPVGSVPLFSWTATNGVWDANGGSDRRAFLSTRNISAGVGVVALDTGTQTVVAVDSATVPTYLSATSVLDFSSIGPGACSDLGFGLAGAAVGDSVAPGWPAGMESGLIGTMRVSAAGTVAVRVCNFSGAALDPAAAVYRATVVRNF